MLKYAHPVLCLPLIGKREGEEFQGEELVRGLIILGNAHDYVNIGLGVRAACVAFRVLRASLWTHVRYLVKFSKAQQTWSVLQILCSISCRQQQP